MTKEQALQIINQATAQAPLPRQAHEQVLQALGVLKKAIAESGAEDKKEKKK